MVYEEKQLNELHLFAGAGGGILGGVLSGWRTACAVELDPIAVLYCSPGNATAFSLCRLAVALALGVDPYAGVLS
jgi:hypothetical protein